MKDFALSRYSLFFSDPAKEVAFREAENPAAIRSLNIQVVIAATFNLLFIFGDYTEAINLSTFWTLLFVRVSLSFMMVAFLVAVHLIRNPLRADYIILVGTIIYAIGFTWIGNNLNPSYLTVSGPIVVVVAYYLFLPQRFVFSILSGTLASLLFLSLYYKNIETTDLVHPITLSYILINIFCIVDIRQMHIKKRRIYHTIEVEKEIRENLRKSNQTLEQLFRVISHDLRGPIGNIMTTFTILSENIFEYEMLSTEQKERFNKLHTFGAKQSESTFALLENLLDWAKRLQGEKKLKFIPMSVKNILDPAIAIFQLQRENKGIAIDCNYISDHHWVFVDPESCQIIFRNIIGNAIKFSHPGGIIKISVSSRENQIHIGIQDSGRGIPKEKLEELQKTHNTESTFGTQNETGAGLGFPLIFQCIEANNGSIDIQSKENLGTTMTVSLPASVRELA